MSETSSNPQALLRVSALSLCGPGGNTILDQVSFELAPGQVLALVGESGSGKTMAARAVLRLLPTGVTVAGGDIQYEGRPVAGLGNEAMRRLRGAAIGMVFQEPMVSLNPSMTVGAQLMEGLLLHEKLKPEAARARAEDMLRRVQIADPAGCMASYPHQFSRRHAPAHHAGVGDAAETQAADRRRAHHRAGLAEPSAR